MIGGGRPQSRACPAGSMVEEPMSTYRQTVPLDTIQRGEV